MRLSQKGIRVPIHGLLAFIVLSSLFFPALTPASFAEEPTRQISQAIAITIEKRANPADPPLVVAGILTIALNVHTGKFTGAITPWGALPPDAPPNTEGLLQPVVLFDIVNGSFMPHEGVTQLAVDGQFHGRAVNMLVRDVGGEGQHIYALGTTENDPGPRYTRDLGRLAGPAVGPEQGTRGDWDIAPSVIDAQKQAMERWRILQDTQTKIFN
jgi:hypothetical protein